MNTEIYYFSSTGNSLAVARDIAKKINAEIISITSILNQEMINIKSDVLGFIFPIYDFKPPEFIEEFINKLDNIKNKYIFAVITYGIDPGKALMIFDKIIKKREGELCGGFAVAMPHNGIGSGMYSKKKKNLMYKEWKEKIDGLSEYILKQEKGRIDKSRGFVSIFLSGFIFKMIPVLFRVFVQAMFKGWKSFEFKADNNCISCGTCEKVCFMSNIKLVSKKPVWSDNCKRCFGCFHWCPKNAVKMGCSTLNTTQHHHPEVKLSDFLNK